MSKDTRGIVLLATGILAGALLGAGASLLAAPKTGEQTRTQIRERSMQLKSQADQTIQTARSRAETALTQVRSRTEELVRKVGNRGNGSPEAANIVVEQ